MEGLRNLFKPSRISKKARKEIPVKRRLDKPTPHLGAEKSRNVRVNGKER